MTEPDGRGTPAVLATLSLATEDDADLQARLRAMATEGGGAAEAAAAVRALIDGDPELPARLRQVAAAVPHLARDGAPEELVARIAAGFDAAAEISPEAAVALHSLGHADRLEAATLEVVERLSAVGFLRPGMRLVEIGCGIGRFADPLTARGIVYRGIDPSARMVETARERHGGPGDSRFARGVGHALPQFPTGSVDGVLAVDVFPYVVQAGGDLPARTFGEIARMLAPGGMAVVLNYSYRGDPVRDRSDMTRLAATAGLDLVRFGDGGFRLWDGRLAMLKRPGTVAAPATKA